MKKGLIGKKLGMTQIYSEKGELVPVTVIECGPCTVVTAKTAAKDGYSALLLAFGSRKAKNVNKSILGNLKPAGLDANPPAVMKEIRLDADPTQQPGDKLDVDLFAVDEYVDITGRTKGHGFQGVVKRWGFAGGRETHGGAWTRRTGSIGACEKPGKVYKGHKMPGHMGDKNRTVQSLKVVGIRPEEHLILVKGAIPGAPGGIVTVRSAVKK
ncbi:MAG: 50S ribosomal protein L3 [Victivallales bacterium]|nr:50S ribosomal protein L3 [Victivallales bacterium]